MNGILFKPDMHQAEREGRKTVTRRLDHLKEINQEPDKWDCSWQMDDETFRLEHVEKLTTIDIKPRYHIGEIVYIKEAYQISNYLYKKYAVFRYKLDNCFSTFDWNEWLEKNTKYGGGADDAEKWRTPLFMPARFARDFIKIIDVRPMRLYPISLSEIAREGFNEPKEFFDKWNNINPDFPWELNPWIWRYEFQLVQKGIEK